MSDLFSALSMAARSMEAETFGLNAAGQNIANINTPGYTRRTVTFVPVPPGDRISAGDGVDVSSIRGERTPFIEGRIRTEQPLVARETAIAGTLDVIQAALGQSGHSIDQRLGDFFDAFAALADDPTSSDARYHVAAEGQALAQSLNGVAGRLALARRDADDQVRRALTQINDLTASLAATNTKLSSATPSEAETLKDQQGADLKTLSGLLDISTIFQNDGTVQVAAGNGRALVAGANSYQVTAVTTPPNGFAALAVGNITVTSEITGGQIGGLLHVRDVMIPGYQTQLDALAYGVATNVNTAHLAGFDLNGNPAVSFFNPIAAAPGAAAAITLNPAILANTQLIAAAGAASPGDNQVARALANLRTTPIAGGTANPIDAWGSVVFQVGSDLSAAQQEQSNRSDVVSQLETLRDQTSGVSLDEEAASLMRFQRAYEASAKFFSTVNQTLDVLMQLQ